MEENGQTTPLPDLRLGTVSGEIPFHDSAVRIMDALAHADAVPIYAAQAIREEGL